MLRRPVFWLSAVALWFVTLFVLSHQSHLQPPGPQFDHRDKVYHAAYFTLGAACFFIALRLWRPSLRAGLVVLCTVTLCMAVGAIDEYHQSFVPNRSGNDIGDWLADTTGGFLGCLLGAWLLRLPWVSGTRKKQPCEP